MSIKFTENQQSAIYTKNTDILVAAAAGSGKTAVLVERIIQNILAKMNGDDGIEIDELLVATFTNASARDMKDKIERALRERLASSEDVETRNYLNEQLLKMNKAHISTLHSFCLYLIQNHYQLIGLTPNVRTVDTIEGELLLEQVIKTTIERKLKSDEAAFTSLTRVFLGNNDINSLMEIVKSAYRNAIANSDVDTIEGELLLEQVIKTTIERKLKSDEAAFTSLTRVFLGNNDINSLMEIVKSAYRNAIANSDVDAFLNNMKDEYIDDTFLDDLNTRYYKHLDDIVSAMASSLQRINEHFDHPSVAEDYEQHEKHRIFNNVKKKIGKMNDELTLIKAELQDENLKTKRLTEFSAADLSNFESYIDMMNPSKSIIISTANLYTKLLSTFTSSFIQSRNDYRDDLRQMNPMRNAFIDLVITVKDEFIKQKRRMGVIDFNDYEHLALEILTHNDVREMYQNKFKEIMIDEYQDTNPAQEAIIARMKSPSNNNYLFMVGDVKQSIYKFRQADPTIFIDKFKRYQSTDDGTLITLNNNFRSSYGVINLTNRVFERIMDESVGDVTYDETQALIYSKNSDSNSGNHAFIENYTQTDEIPNFKEHYVVERIKMLKESGEKYKDIVLLTRAKTHHIELQQLLRKYDIPSHIESDKGYFESTEIRTIKSILHVIDNPLQDDHLVGVMRLPYFDFDVNEISKIRASSEHMYLYEALSEYKNNFDDALANRIAQFISRVEYFRTESQYLSVHELIELVYREIRLIEFFSAMYNGEVRKANLHQFQHQARLFEARRHITLFEFLSYINELLDEDKDMGETSILTESDDVVRIMTIHKSKGLEFKNVIYYHLEKDIVNPQRSEPSIHLHNTYGLAVKTFDAEDNTMLRNMHSVLLADTMKEELYSEEIRLMYVAFTRAE